MMSKVVIFVAVLCMNALSSGSAVADVSERAKVVSACKEVFGNTAVGRNCAIKAAKNADVVLACGEALPKEYFEDSWRLQCVRSATNPQAVKACQPFTENNVRAYLNCAVNAEDESLVTACIDAFGTAASALRCALDRS